MTAIGPAPVNLFPERKQKPTLDIHQIIKFQKKKFLIYKEILTKGFKKIKEDYPDSLMFDSIKDLVDTGGDCFIIAQVDSIKESQKIKKVSLVDPTGILNVTLIKEDCKGQEYLIAGGVLGFIVNSKDKSYKSKLPSEKNFLDHFISKSKISEKLDFIVKEVIYPNFNKALPQKKPLGLGVAMVADVHVGAKTFIESNFLQMINYVNQDPSIGYLIIAGDATDGNSVYPNQRNDLKIPSLEDQIHYLGKVLSGLNEKVHIILAMGNHDGPRREPQFWPESTKEILSKYHPKMFFTTNPGYVQIGNYRFFIYHGASQDVLISRCPKLSYEDPTSIGELMLKYRNLCPCTDKIPITATNHCYHVVPEDIDYLILGHIHKRGVKSFDKRLCISASTWQHITPFQERLGFKPDYCILDVIYPGDHSNNKYVDFKDNSTNDYTHFALK